MSVFESRIDHLVRLVSLDGLQRGDVEAGAGVRGEQGPRGLFKKNFCVSRIKYAAKIIIRTSPRCQHFPDGVILGGHRVAPCFKMQSPLFSNIKETFFPFRNTGLRRGDRAGQDVRQVPAGVSVGGNERVQALFAGRGLRQQAQALVDVFF